MKEIIASDLDEVLADLISPLTSYVNKRFDKNIKLEDYKTYKLFVTWGCSSEESWRIADDFYATKDFDNLLPIANSQNVVSLLKKDYDLYVITSRPYHTKEKTVDWLNKHFSNTFSDVYLTNNQDKFKKSDICNRLNASYFIDDSFENILDVAENSPSVKKLFLMDRPWNQNVKLTNNMYRIKNWSELSYFFIV